jgi:hypothetical protein
MPLKKILAFLIAGLLSGSGLNLYAELPEYDTSIYYLYEVGNEIQLSDFEMGSDEKIKDKDGNGIGFNWLLKKGEKVILELDGGYSRTIYKGQVEDGVEVSFSPQAGEGYDALSSSKNVTYDFDLEFQNPYIGLNVGYENFRIGGGRIFQSSKGDIKIYAEDFEIVRAEYETGTQLYYQLGFELHLEDLFFKAFFRAFEAPALNITYCNAAALGTLVCNRIEGATGNRNNRSTSYGEGLLEFGMYF